MAIVKIKTIIPNHVTIVQTCDLELIKCDRIREYKKLVTAL